MMAIAVSLIVEELAATYAAADVFVFPSLTDTFGVVMLEANACGLPVAAFPVTGPVDVVIEGRNGALDKDLRAAAQRCGRGLEKTYASWLNGDGYVGGGDLGAFFVAWGPCS